MMFGRTVFELCDCEQKDRQTHKQTD